MPIDSGSPYLETLRSIRTRYDLPTEMDEHLHCIIAQATDEPTPAANANQTATRVQRLLTYLMEDYRNTYPEAAAVRDELAAVYGDIVDTDWETGADSTR